MYTIHPFICQSDCSSNCQSDCSSIHPSILYLSVYAPIQLSIFLLYVYPSIRQSICTLIYPCINLLHPSVHSSITSPILFSQSPFSLPRIPVPIYLFYFSFVQASVHAFVHPYLPSSPHPSIRPSVYLSTNVSINGLLNNLSSIRYLLSSFSSFQ